MILDLLLALLGLNTSNDDKKGYDEKLDQFLDDMDDDDGEE